MLRKIGPPVLSGILLFLSFPKWNLGALAWFALVPLLFAAVRSGSLQAFLSGWLAGWVGFCGILYWMVPTFMAAKVPGWLGVLSVGLLAGYLALFSGAFAWSARWLHGRASAPAFAVLAAAAWVVLEAARGRLFGGFPWLLLGVSQWRAVPLIQVAEWTGVYGVSASVALVNAFLFLAVSRRRPDRLLGLMIAAVLAADLWLLRRSSDRPDEGGIRVAVLQGNIDQYKKWDRSYVREILEVYSALSGEAASALAGMPEPRLIVWPETAAPGWVPNEPWLTDWLGRTVRETGCHHLVGAVSREEGGNYNSAFLIAPDGGIRARYDKIHLVPFGEFVPFQEVLGGMIAVLNDLGGFESGRESQVITVPGAAFGVSVCYEMIFPELIRRQPGAGARFLVNVTNDGWYLDTAAPEQHFAMNVLRAVENRRAVVRAANTGISGVIGPEGRVESKSVLGRREVLSAPVPFRSETTFYSRHGNAFAGACGLLLAAAVPAIRNKKRKEHENT